jgi:nucleolin
VVAKPAPVVESDSSSSSSEAPKAGSKRAAKTKSEAVKKKKVKESSSSSSSDSDVEVIPKKKAPKVKPATESSSESSDDEAVPKKTAPKAPKSSSSSSSDDEAPKKAAPKAAAKADSSSSSSDSDAPKKAAPKKSSSSSSDSDAPAAKKADSDSSSDEKPAAEESSPEPQRAAAPAADEHAEIFVGNLPWSANEDSLKEYLTYYGEVTKVKVLVDHDGRSKGVGFVEFASKEAAEKACKEGGNMDGRDLKINMSNKREERAPVQANPDAEGSCTLFCGNVSFEATQDDLRQLFSDIGDVTDVRIATDPETGNSRGFAHIEFSNPDDAKSALSLNG